MEQPLVPLKKVCRDANVDPRVARRILRAKGKRPGGRWAWKASNVKKVVEFLKREVTNAKAD